MNRIKLTSKNRQRYFCLGWLLAINLLGPKIQAGESQLDILYRQFITTNADLHAFVSFERKTVIPKNPAQDQDIKLKDGRVVHLRIWDKDYFAFCCDGPDFVIGFSHTAAITNENSLVSAEKLYGFDGENYWFINMNNPITMATGSTTNALSLSFNTLTLVPSKEATREQNQFGNNIILATIKGLAVECLSVVHFGCEYNLQSFPQITGSELNVIGVDGHKQKARLIGAAEEPTDIIYEPSATNGAITDASIDRNKNLLTVTRSSGPTGTNIFFQAEYHILDVRLLNLPQKASLFSWQTYKNSAGNIIGMMLTNGSLVQVDFNKSNELQLGYLISPSTPATARWQLPKSYIYILFVIANIGAFILLIWVSKHKQK